MMADFLSWKFFKLPRIQFALLFANSAQPVLPIIIKEALWIPHVWNEAFANQRIMFICEHVATLPSACFC